MVSGWCGQVCEINNNLRIKQCRIFNFIPKGHLLGGWGVAQARVSIFRNTFERYEIQNVFLYCFFVLFYFLQFYVNKSNAVVRWLSLLAHSKKYSDLLITWGLSGVEFALVGSLSSCKQIRLRLTHDSQLAIGLNFGMNGCLSFCVWVYPAFHHDSPNSLQHMNWMSSIDWCEEKVAVIICAENRRKMSEDSKSCEKEQQCDHKSKTVPMLETYTNTSNVSSASAKAIY